MAHYAVLDENNVVTLVHPGKDEGEDGIDWESYYGAKRTSYNTIGGVHYDATTREPSVDQSKAFRYNYAGEKFTFSDDPMWAAQGGAFIPPQPFPSWVINPATADWMPPTPRPLEGALWWWDEGSQSWVETEMPPPASSWTWDADAGMWTAPLPYPEDGLDYWWDEGAQAWVPIPE